MEERKVILHRRRTLKTYSRLISVKQGEVCESSEHPGARLFY